MFVCFPKITLREKRQFFHAPWQIPNVTYKFGHVHLYIYDVTILLLCKVSCDIAIFNACLCSTNVALAALYITCVICCFIMLPLHLSCYLIICDVTWGAHLPFESHIWVTCCNIYAALIQPLMLSFNVMTMLPTCWIYVGLFPQIGGGWFVPGGEEGTKRHTGPRRDGRGGHGWFVRGGESRSIAAWRLSASVMAVTWPEGQEQGGF